MIFEVYFAGVTDNKINHLSALQRENWLQNMLRALKCVVGRVPSSFIQTHQQLQFIRMPSVYKVARWARNRVRPCTGWLLPPTTLALISIRVKIINDYDDPH